MWIAHLGIGHKKLLAITLLFATVLIVVMRFEPILTRPAITAAVMFFINVAYVAYKKGVFIRRFVFNVDNQAYEVLDYFSFSKPKDNYRSIVYLKSGAVLSSMYLTKQNVWKYFDFIRHVFVDFEHPVV